MDDRQDQVGYCGQQNVMWDALTVRENVEYIAVLRGFGRAAREERQRVLQLVGLHQFHDRRAGDLSGGMKRRLCLAMALVGSPAVLIADEPSAGLDPASRQRMCDVLQRVKQHCAVILVTHDMDEVRAVADRVALMTAGKFLFLGPLDELLHSCGVAAMLRITYSEAHANTSRAFLRKHLPELLVWRASSTSAMLILPSAARCTVSAVAQFMATRGPEGAVSEWGIGACDANTAVATILRSGDAASGSLLLDFSSLGANGRRSLLLAEGDDDDAVVTPSARRTPKVNGNVVTARAPSVAAFGFHPSDPTEPLTGGVAKDNEF